MNTLRNFIVIFFLGAAIFLAGVLLGKTLSDLEHERRPPRVVVHPLPTPPRETVVQVEKLPPQPEAGKKKPVPPPLPPAVKPLTAAAPGPSGDNPPAAAETAPGKKVKLTFYDTLTDDHRQPAVARKKKKATTRKPAAPPPSPAAKPEKPLAGDKNALPAKGGLSLQVGSFPQEGQARLFRQRLAGKGYGKVVVVPAEIPGKGTWYRVRIVGLASRRDADILRQQLRSREKIKAFLVK